MSDIIEYMGMSEDLLGEDFLGEDDLAYDELGRRRRRAMRRRPAGDMRWTDEIRRGAPGAPAISEKLLPIGLGGFQFTATSGTDADLLTTVNVAFRLERLVADVRRIGASAQGLIVAITDLKIGSNSQFAANTSVPAEIFRADAYDTRLACDPITPGVIIQVRLALQGGTLAGSDVVNVLIGATGRAIR